MRGIPEDKAVEIGEQIDSCKYLECSVKEWLRDECQELNPWMTLEEFLKSGFYGLCWICTREKEIIKCHFNGVVFSHGRRSIISVIFATHVQPIHKPEPVK